MGNLLNGITRGTGITEGKVEEAAKQIAQRGMAAAELITSMFKGDFDATEIDGIKYLVIKVSELKLQEAGNTIYFDLLIDPVRGFARNVVRDKNGAYFLSVGPERIWENGFVGIVNLLEQQATCSRGVDQTYNLCLGSKNGSKGAFASMETLRLQIGTVLRKYIAEGDLQISKNKAIAKLAIQHRTKKEDEVRPLRAEAKMLRDKIRTLESEIPTLNRELKKLQKGIEDEGLFATQEMLNTLDTLGKTIEEKTFALHAKIEELQNALNQIVVKIETASKSIAEIQKEIDGLYAENESIRKKQDRKREQAEQDLKNLEEIYKTELQEAFDLQNLLDLESEYEAIGFAKKVAEAVAKIATSSPEGLFSKINLDEYIKKNCTKKGVEILSNVRPNLTLPLRDGNEEAYDREYEDAGQDNEEYNAEEYDA